jgi:exocyst complex component 4
MFKLQDMDSKSADLTTEREDLQTILTTSVPGLVSDLKRTDSSEPTGGSSTVDGSATGHRLLADPSVFNMAILLPPSLVFLNRLKEVVPPSADIAMSTLTSFLDDFLINVFLPQLDETLVEMSSQIFIETDAFQQDPNWQNHSKRPIFKVRIGMHADGTNGRRERQSSTALLKRSVECSTRCLTTRPLANLLSRR